MANEYRIRNHPLEEVGDYTMTLYIDMLCTVASYENADPEAAYKLIANIMLSAEMKHPISEHIKNAMQLTPDRFSEFVTECRNNELQYIFLIDSLLIICSNGQPCKKQIEFIAGLAEAFSIYNHCFRYLAIIAEKILKQDSYFFTDFERKLPKGFDKNFFSSLTRAEITEIFETNAQIDYSSMCYVKQFTEGVILKLKTYRFLSKDVKSNTYITEFPEYSQKIYYESYYKPKSFNHKNFRQFNYNTIIMENVIFPENELYSLHEYMFGENNLKKAILRNCTLGAIYSCETLELENCLFDRQNIGSLMHCSSYITCNDGYAVNCTFSNLSLKSSHVNNKYVRNILLFEEHSNIKLLNCEFVECDIIDFPDNYREFKNITFRKCRINIEHPSIFQSKLDFLNQNGCQFIDCY